jgi:hypothetical protein
VSSVATSYDGQSKTAAIERDNATASQGLTPEYPVKLSVRLMPGDNRLSLDDIELADSSADTQVLYQNAVFTSEVEGDVQASWGSDPTPVYLKTTSGDDDATNVYYELDIYTVRYIGFKASQTGGASDVRTSTGIDIGFMTQGGADVNVKGLTSSDITLTGAGGAAVKGGLSGNGLPYTLAVADVEQGEVGVEIADWAGYTVSPPNVNVTLYRDTTPPTASIDIRGNEFKKFINWLTFGLFFKDNADVTITPADEDGDGVAQTEYLLNPEPDREGTADDLLEAVEAGDISWTSGRVGEGTTQFSVQPGQKGAVYAKVTDKAGNSVVINSEGVVVYTDSGAEGDTQGMTFVRMSGADKTANVTMGGNSIEKIVSDMATPEIGDDYTLIRGKDYEAFGELAENRGVGDAAPYVGDGLVTFKASYLSGLDASAEGSPYTLRIHYDPLGEKYVDGDGAGDGNEAPAESEITLEVIKAVASVRLTATPDPVYGENNVTLSASVTTDAVTSPLPATGQVTWYEGEGTGKPLGTAPLDENGEASLTLDKLPAGDYPLIHADYSGDGNYTDGTDSITGYRVAKARQESIVITVGGQAKTELTKIHGDAPFTLGFSGGSGTGAFGWTSDKPAVAEVDSASGEVTVKAAGAANITLSKPGDANYEDADPATLRLTVDEESTPPVPGGGLAPANIEDTSLDLSWTEATDNLSAQEDIVYYVYLAARATNVLVTPADCASNGTLLTSGKAKSSYPVTGLIPGTSYWLNVVAEDEAGNAAAYEAVRAITPRKLSIEKAEQTGGVDGKAPSTGIRLTFSEPVSGFSSEAVALDGGVAKNGAVAPVSGSDGKTYILPISVTGENRSSVEITVNEFTDPANEQRYIVDPPTGEVTDLYRPVPYDKPEAAIDYVGENITQLEEGGVYKFSMDGGATYGAGRTISPGGIYPMPYSEFGITLEIKRSGTDIPNDAHVDSPAQTLPVPARPVSPVIDVDQPTTAEGDT